MNTKGYLVNQKLANETETEQTQTDAEMKPSINWVAIREDSLKTVQEIADQLASENIPHQIDLAPGCKNGSCSLKYLLMVPAEQAQKGLLVIENYFIALHPEFQIAKELEAQGKCPACGFDNGHNAKTCGDCGLELIIEY